MSAADHTVASVKHRGRVWTCTCACGAVFQSVDSEGMARSHHSGHRRLMRNPLYTGGQT